MLPFIPGAYVTVTRHRPVFARDEYRSKVPVSYSDAAVEGCSWQPTSGSEFHDGGNRLTVDGTLYMPPDADVMGLDEITVPGVGRLNVEGPVQEWPNVGGLAHKVCRLVRYKEGV